MKTSNKLILALFAITLLAIVGSNLVLKAEYEKINFEDPFYKYGKETLPPFSAVRLQGNSGLVHIQPSKSFEIRILQGKENKIDWEIHGDTLILSCHNGRSPFYGNIFNYPPIAFVMAPSLQALHSTEINCKLTNWRDTDLLLTSGNSKVLLLDSRLEKLNANIEEGGLLKIAATNQIQRANIEVRDTSTLIVEKDVFQSFEINIDEQANVKLPGALFSKLIKE